MLDFMPQDRRAAVESALSAVFGQAQIDRATPLRDGFSGAVVACVEAGGRKALLRIETARDALRDPNRQYACLAAAAEAGIAPALRHADPEAGVAVMDFVEALPISQYPGGGPAAALELAGLTRRLRATAPFPPLVEHIEAVDGLLRGVLAGGLFAPEAIALHLAAWERLRDACPRLAVGQRVSSHNDLNPNNVLYDGERLWLVDWETAFASDPLVDLASIATWYGVADHDEEALLRTAFDAVDDGLRGRFFLMRQVCLAFNAALMLMLVALGRTSATPIDDVAAPAFAQVRGGLARRTVDLATEAGRLLFAKAALNAMVDSVRGLAFDRAADRANTG